MFQIVCSKALQKEMDIDPVDKNADGSFDQENTVQNNKKRQLYDNNLFFNDESAQYGKA